MFDYKQISIPLVDLNLYNQQLAVQKCYISAVADFKSKRTVILVSSVETCLSNAKNCENCVNGFCPLFGNLFHDGRTTPTNQITSGSFDALRHVRIFVPNYISLDFQTWSVLRKRFYLRRIQNVSTLVLESKSTQRQTLAEEVLYGLVTVTYATYDILLPRPMTQRCFPKKI